MAKGKSLLTESEVRKFMKFANIPHLAENFFKEGSYVEEGGMEETMHGATDEMVYEEEEEAEAPAVEAPAADAEDMATRLVKAIAAAISAETGIQVGVEGDGATPEAPADGMEAEMPPAEEEEGALEDEGALDTEALAEAVLRRVMKRVGGLNEAKERKAKIAKRVDEVTDRIMRRITR